MPKPFDATLKQLIDAYAADWVSWLGPLVGLPPGVGLEPLDADLSASRQADKLFRLRPPHAGLVHFELQTGWDDSLPNRAVVYNVVAEDRHGGPVWTVILLLRRTANMPALTGVLQRHRPDGSVYLEFRYAVVKLWELSADDLLKGPLGTLPLAPLTDDAAGRLDEVVAEVDRRLKAEVPADEARELRTATYILLGLRVSKVVAGQIMQRVTAMEESTTYQFIVEKGRKAGLKEGELRATQALIVRLGTKRLGLPSAADKAVLAAVRSAKRLERIADRLDDAKDWADLLATR